MGSQKLPTQAFVHVRHKTVVGDFSDMMTSAYCWLVVSCEKGWENKGGEGWGGWGPGKGRNSMHTRRTS